MNVEKLKRLQAQVRIGGKGTPRRKKKVMHQTAATDDKKLQSSLKKLSVSTIPGIEEVNIIKDDLTVIHFNNPKAQASLSANTFAVTGHGESKKVVEMLPEILPQLGQETVVQLRCFANCMSNNQKGLVSVTEEDDVPSLVSDFDEASKHEVNLLNTTQNDTAKSNETAPSKEQNAALAEHFNAKIDDITLKEKIDEHLNKNTNASTNQKTKEKSASSDSKENKKSKKQEKNANKSAIRKAGEDLILATSALVAEILPMSNEGHNNIKTKEKPPIGQKTVAAIAKDLKSSSAEEKKSLLTGQTLPASDTVNIKPEETKPVEMIQTTALFADKIEAGQLIENPLFHQFTKTNAVNLLESDKPLQETKSNKSEKTVESPKSIESKGDIKSEKKTDVAAPTSTAQFAKPTGAMSELPVSVKTTNAPEQTHQVKVDIPKNAGKSMGTIDALDTTKSGTINSLQSIEAEKGKQSPKITKPIKVIEEQKSGKEASAKLTKPLEELKDFETSKCTEASKHKETEKFTETTKPSEIVFPAEAAKSIEIPITAETSKVIELGKPIEKVTSYDALKPLEMSKLIGAPEPPKIIESAGQSKLIEDKKRTEEVANTPSSMPSNEKPDNIVAPMDAKPTSTGKPDNIVAPMDAKPTSTAKPGNVVAPIDEKPTATAQTDNVVAPKDTKQTGTAKPDKNVALIDVKQTDTSKPNEKVKSTKPTTLAETLTPDTTELEKPSAEPTKNSTATPTTPEVSSSTIKLEESTANIVVTKPSKKPTETKKTTTKPSTSKPQDMPKPLEVKSSQETKKLDQTNKPKQQSPKPQQKQNSPLSSATNSGTSPKQPQMPRTTKPQDKQAANQTKPQQKTSTAQKTTPQTKSQSPLSQSLAVKTKQPSSPKTIEPTAAPGGKKSESESDNKPPLQQTAEQKTPAPTTTKQASPKPRPSGKPPPQQQQQQQAKPLPKSQDNNMQQRKQQSQPQSPLQQQPLNKNN